MWISKLRSWLRNLLKVSPKHANFAQQVERERKAYNNLVIQQSVMLDEYEDLVKAYDEELNSSNSNKTTA